MSGAISMDSIKNKLKNLRNTNPGEDENIYIFAEFLANRLNGNLNSQGLYMTIQLSLMDLQSGIDGFSGEPIQNKLVGYPTTVYSILQLIFVDHIVGIVCTKEFAEKVKEVHKHVCYEMKGTIKK